MTAAERRALLGDAVIAHIHDRVEDAPEPTPEVVASLRRILTRSADHIEELPPATQAA